MSKLQCLKTVSFNNICSENALITLSVQREAGGETDCGSRCKKQDIVYVTACSNCKRSGCVNSFKAAIDDVEDDEISYM